jgi:hypothetical protein
MRTMTLVNTLKTGKEVTSIETVQDGRYITTADGTEARNHPFSCHPTPPDAHNALQQRDTCCRLAKLCMESMRSSGRSEMDWCLLWMR